MVTLIEPAVIATEIGDAVGEAPSAFERLIAVTPAGALAVSDAEIVASVPLAMMLEFVPSAIQV